MGKENVTGELRLPVHLTSQDIEELCKQYKLTGSTAQQLRVLAAGLMSRAKVQVFYRLLPERENNLLLTAITLGKQLDDWIEEQMQAQQLTEACLTDILAGRLLMKTYGLWSEIILKKSDIRLGQFHFIGDEIPLNKLPEYLGLLAQSEIHINQACTMTPSKTVLFLAETGAENTGGFSCRSCSHKSCPNRNDHPLPGGHS